MKNPAYNIYAYVYIIYIISIKYFIYINIYIYNIYKIS